MKDRLKIAKRYDDMIVEEFVRSLARTRRGGSLVLSQIPTIANTLRAGKMSFRMK